MFETAIGLRLLDRTTTRRLTLTSYGEAISPKRCASWRGASRPTTTSWPVEGAERPAQDRRARRLWVHEHIAAIASDFTKFQRAVRLHLGSDTARPT